MATVRAPFHSFDINSVNLSHLVAGTGTAAFTNDIRTTLMWQEVSDLLLIQWSGDHFISLGGNMTYDARSGALTGGKIMVIAEHLATEFVWGIEYTSLSATAVYNAAITASTVDDQNLIRLALAGDDEFHLSTRADKARGYSGNDHMYGKLGNDVLYGGVGWDRLYGGDGTDSLHAGTGRDVLNGGRGLDRLYGGTDAGGDQFIFSSIQESVVGLNRDVIYNYTRGSDIITLSQIDARPVTATDNAFASGGNTPTAHGVWWRAVDAGVLVQADVSGDAKADFEIMMHGVTSVWGSDFML